MSKKDREKNRSKRKTQAEQLKKRMKKSHEKSEGFRSDIFLPNKKIPTWNPKDGQHTIDLIPYIAGKKDPSTEPGNATYTFEYMVHKNVGMDNKWFVCPSMFGKKCPICEYRQKLRDKDNDDYKKYWPKTRNIYNIVCHDSPKEKKKGVQI